MLREAYNNVMISGILSENKLEETTYIKDGKEVPCIRGELVIKTEQNINGKLTKLEIPVKVFSNKYKKDGNPSKIFDSLKKIKEDYCSIAAVGEEKADYIRISGGKLSMNDFPSRQTGEIVSYPEITSNFFSRIKKEECKPEATFSVEMVVGDIYNEVDSNGDETGNVILKGIIPNFSGNVIVVPFKIMSPKVIDAIGSYWQKGDTVKASGRINFSTQTITKTSQDDFSDDDPIERSYTKKISEFIITGGTQEPYDEERAFDNNEIAAALTKRKAMLDEKKNSAQARAETNRAPARGADGSFNFGF